MAELGRYNRLSVIESNERGTWLDGGAHGRILLPRKQTRGSLQTGDQVDVFVYHDSKERLSATMRRPKAQVGECAWLEVVSTGKHGAFLDWGLPKDLFVPLGEQQRPMQKGRFHAVCLYIDEATGRVVASSKLEKHLSLDGRDFSPRQAVDCLIYARSDLGYKAVIDHTHLGQFYANETFRPLHLGDRVQAWVKQVRDDGRIDLVLQLPSQRERDRLGEAIIRHLRDNSGVSTLTDHSPPEDIYRTFGVSKANYKKALGRLYKRREILIEKHRITLL
jgi:predicted RNA-binding protein (virulence factor B family)